MSEPQFPFNIPPEVRKRLERNHALRKPVWERYHDPAPHDEYFDPEREMDPYGDDEPWGLATLSWWEHYNRPLWDTLKEALDYIDHPEPIEGLLLHFDQALDDLKELISIARSTWMYDPILSFVRPLPESGGEDNNKKIVNMTQP